VGKTKRNIFNLLPNPHWRERVRTIRYDTQRRDGTLSTLNQLNFYSAPYKTGRRRLTM